MVLERRKCGTLLVLMRGRDGTGRGKVRSESGCRGPHSTMRGMTAAFQIPTIDTEKPGRGFLRSDFSASPFPRLKERAPATAGWQHPLQRVIYCCRRPDPFNHMMRASESASLNSVLPCLFGGLSSSYLSALMRSHRHSYAHVPGSSLHFLALSLTRRGFIQSPTEAPHF